MTPPRNIRNLALVGFMGAGKSCVGRLAAQWLQYAFVDTDELIEQRAGKPITEIFAREGELLFREFERQVVAELTTCERTVIATGGGLVARGDHLASLKTHALVVCLWASPEVIWERVRRHQHRPLLAQAADAQTRIRELLAVRTPFYQQADVLVNTDQRTITEVTAHVVQEFLAAIKDR